MLPSLSANLSNAVLTSCCRYSAVRLQHRELPPLHMALELVTTLLMSLIAELKHRNVFRVGIAYGVNVEKMGIRVAADCGLSESLSMTACKSDSGQSASHEIHFFFLVRQENSQSQTRIGGQTACSEYPRKRNASGVQYPGVGKPVST